jgi:hypothetical protein
VPTPTTSASVDAAAEQPTVETDAATAIPQPSAEPATDAAPQQKELVPDDAAPKTDDPYAGDE